MQINKFNLINNTSFNMKNLQSQCTGVQTFLLVLIFLLAEAAIRTYSRKIAALGFCR